MSRNESQRVSGKDLWTSSHLVLRTALLVLLSVVYSCLSSCSSSGSETGRDTGSISFSLRFPGEQPSSKAFGDEGDRISSHCEDYGFATVEVDVFDETRISPIASGGPWECRTGEGTIENVGRGQDRSILVSLKNSGGNSSAGNDVGHHGICRPHLRISERDRDRAGRGEQGAGHRQRLGHGGPGRHGQQARLGLPKRAGQ